MNSNPILILADPKGNAWDFAEKVCTKANSYLDRQMKYCLDEINFKNFPNGESLPYIKENVRGHDCWFIHDSSMRPAEWLVSLGLVNDALMRASAETINDVLPFMPYQRQDRITGRTAISASHVKDVIQKYGNKVISSDLHNPATASSYDIPFDNLKAYPVLIGHLQKNYPEFLENAVIVAPDVGSANRAESYQKRLGLPVAIIDKQRDEHGTVKKMGLVGNVQGKNALMVDDMIDTGGTIIKCAETLKKEGAEKVWICATHGIYSDKFLARVEDSELEKIIITDSIPTKEPEKVEIVSLTDLLYETISRISHGKSVSSLFN
jgi:ribose-phosphate pyrophosphokinase